jgi:hypothetical protein
MLGYILGLVDKFSVLQYHVSLWLEIYQRIFLANRSKTPRPLNGFFYNLKIKASLTWIYIRILASSTWSYVGRVEKIAYPTTNRSRKAL